MLAPIAAIILSAALLGGALLARRHAHGRSTPLALGLGHGATALTGFVLLAIAVVQTAQPLAVNAAVLLFALALIGGLFVLVFRLQGEAPPGFMIALHAFTAGIALIMLWIGLLLLA